MTMATPLYARYIPPKKNLVSKEPAAHHQQIQRSSSPPAVVVIESERKKKDRKEPKKPKKRKAPVEDEAVDDVEDEVLTKRHEAVFAKFNRAAKISEKIKERHAEEPEDSNPDGNEAPLVLHG